MRNIDNPSGRKDLSGQKFSQLTVIEYAFTKNKRAYWNCVCECGKTKVANGKTLLNGDTKSCGCLYGEIHGMEKSGEYTSWCGMKYRCYNSRCKKFKDYGGRGIKVCDRWLNSFKSFYEDMGPKPSPNHSIERNDVNGNYEPGNCRWATIIEQANNRRSNHTATINGETKNITQWCEFYGIVTSGRALTRINKFGWEPIKAVTTPHRKMTYEKK